jgi:hypothetical protein
MRPAKADDLAAPHEKAGVLTHQAFGDLGMTHPPVPDLEEGRANVRGPLREACPQGAANHAANDTVLVQPRIDPQGLDRLAIADDGDGIGDGPDLVQLMADHDGGDALGAQPPQQVQQVGGVVLVEGRGGLVEDQQPDFLAQGLGDLDELLLAHADILDGGVRVLAQAHPRHEFPGAGLGPDPVDDTGPGHFVAEKEVFGDGQFGNEGQFLMNDGDPGLLAGADILEGHRLVIKEDVARVAAMGIDPRQHLHQGGFASPVLAADGVNFPRLDPHGDSVEGPDPRELLGDVTHFEDSCHGLFPTSLPRGYLRKTGVVV